MVTKRGSTDSWSAVVSDLEIGIYQLIPMKWKLISSWKNLIYFPWQFSSHRYLILLTIVPLIYDSVNCVSIRQWYGPAPYLT